MALTEPRKTIRVNFSGVTTKRTTQHRFAVTFFHDEYARTKEEETHTLDSLANRIRQQHSRVKAQLPWMKPAWFGDRASDKDCLRNDANVDGLTGLIVEHDGQKHAPEDRVNFEEARRRLEDLGICGVLYTTPGNKPGEPHWRLVVPFKAGHEPGEHKSWVSKLDWQLGGGVLSNESKTLSQSYYFGSVPGRPCRVSVLRGSCVDQVMNGVEVARLMPSPKLTFVELPYDEALRVRFVPLKDRVLQYQRDYDPVRRAKYNRSGPGQGVINIITRDGFNGDETFTILRSGDAGPDMRSWAEDKPDAVMRSINTAFESGIVIKAAERPWPEPMKQEAFYGVTGEFVRLVLPQTEACDEALLINFLAMFGNSVGRGPYYVADGAEHHANIYTVLVGSTAEGKKGTATRRARGPFSLVEESPTDEAKGYGPWKGTIVHGLSTGEGLIHHLRGSDERRGLAIEEEFGRTLIVLSRPGNTLSPILRTGWDDGSLRTMTKTDPMHVEGVHFSMIGHTTPEELKRNLNTTECANGFANRILWCCTKRSKFIPDGEERINFAPMARRLEQIIRTARTREALYRDDAAREHWHRVYEKLVTGRPGLAGEITARAAPQVVRLSLIYALLDSSPVVKLPHLKAALAVWDYCQNSVMHLFSESTGDIVADRIRDALRKQGEMTRTEIRDLFGRHKKQDELDRALNTLGASIERTTRATGGRSVDIVRWVG